MKTRIIYSEKGTARYNEDRVGSYRNVAWVIDGATPLFQETYLSEDNDVVWLVETLHKWLPHFIRDEESLEEILSRTLAHVEQEALGLYPGLGDIAAYALPTFTVAMVRLSGGRLEYYVLGDAGVLAALPDGILWMTDDRLEVMSRRVRQEAVADKPVLLQAIRQKLNTAEGYWIGSIDGAGIPHGYAGEMKVEPGTRVMCVSDGYSRLFELFDWIEAEQLKLDDASVKATVAKVREIEMADAEGVRFPRAKCHDDLSVVLVESE